MAQQIETDAVIAQGERIQPPHENMLHLDDYPQAEWVVRTKDFIRDRLRVHGGKLAVVQRSENEPQLDGVHAAIGSHFAQMLVDELTVAEKAPLVARLFVESLRDRPLRFVQGQPLQGYPAFIVAAGPSLDVSGEFLAQCKEHGTLIAVNTSARACIHHGVEPDLVVSVESKPLPDHFDGVASRSVGDVTSAQENWACMNDPMVIANNEPCFVPYLLEMGATPTPYIGSVACAATSIALGLGAGPIVLIGQDLGYPDGQVYGSHTPFGDIRARYENGGVHFTGKSKEMATVAGFEAPGVGGKPCITTHNLMHFARWFETVARHVPIINASGGVRIDGSIELPLPTVLASLTRRGRPEIPRPPEADKSQAIERLKREASDAMGTGATRPTFPLLGLHTAAAVILAKNEGLRGLDFMEAINMAVDEGCRMILEVLE